MTVLISRRGRTLCALATTLAAGSLTLMACATDRVGGPESEAEPPKVATAMGTRTGGTSTSMPQSATMAHTASRETTLTAQAFMDYLDDEQQKQILGEGLLLNDLTRAQQITLLQVLESLLSDHSYRTVAALFDRITNSPDAAPHHLRFSRIPAMDEQWRLAVDGPMLGLHAHLAARGDITLESAHMTLHSDDANAISAAAELDDDDDDSTAVVHESATEFYGSLDPGQLYALTTPGGGGLRGADLSDSQRQMLIDVFFPGEDDTGSAKQDRIIDTLDDTVFSLSGDPTDPDAHELSLRVDGPEIFLEITGTPVEDGGSALRSVYKDPSLS